MYTVLYHTSVRGISAFHLLPFSDQEVPDHPHRFRHTLAADLLMKGASCEDVAAILGNSPAIVQKHYSQWIKGRQDRLDSILESTWEKPRLQRVK